MDFLAFYGGRDGASTKQGWAIHKHGLGIRGVFEDDVLHLTTGNGAPKVPVPEDL